jgi:hypothetical protein
MAYMFSLSTGLNNRGNRAEKGLSRRQKAYPGIPTRVPFPREKECHIKDGELGTAEQKRNDTFFSLQFKPRVVC